MPFVSLRASYRVANDILLATVGGDAREYLVELSDEDGISLWKCLLRLGWWFPIEDNRNAQERLDWWLFRENVSRRDTFGDGHHIETAEQRIADAVADLKSLANEVVFDSDSCLGVDKFVWRMLEGIRQKRFPLEHNTQRCGWPDNWETSERDSWIECHDSFRIRFDAEFVNAGLLDAACQLNLRPCALKFREGSDDSCNDYDQARKDIEQWLERWRCRLETEIFARGELVRGWEPNKLSKKRPDSPIRNVEHLRVWLDQWRYSVQRAASSVSDLMPTADAYLGAVICELRNARRAMLAWNIPLPAKFNDNPPDIHEAERQLELLISDLAPTSANANDKSLKPFEVEEEQSVKPEAAMPPSCDGANVKPPIEADFVFRRDGIGYFIKGLGEEGRVPADRAKGLHDLFRVIQFPGISIPLRYLEAGPESERTWRSTQPVSDAEMDRQLRDRQLALKTEIESAVIETERDELQKELDAVVLEAMKLKGLNGQPRDLNNPLEKLRPKYLDRIRTAVARIRKCGLEHLANHFDLAVTTKEGGLLYSPTTPNLIWDTLPKK